MMKENEKAFDLLIKRIDRIIDDKKLFMKECKRLIEIIKEYKELRTIENKALLLACEEICFFKKAKVISYGAFINPKEQKKEAGKLAIHFIKKAEGK